MSAIGIEDLELIPKTRISGRVKAAIRFMVECGLNRADAAAKAGLQDNSLYIALRKPDVCTFRNELMQVFRESAASRTIAKAEKLMDGAQSEHVQADMTKWLAALEGISPITKTENLTIHKGITPGLTLNLIVGQAPIDDARVIDGLAHQVQSQRNINALPRPVPHPTMRNATKTDGQPAKTEGRGQGRRGAKP